MKALVTGANGFIGSHLVDRLVKAGYEVSCLIRESSTLTWLSNLDVHFLKGNLADTDFLNRVVKGYDYIFHIAGLTKASHREAFYSINSKLTENVVNAVANNNPHVKRFVYLSSLSAFGPGRDNVLPTEKENPHPVSDYGKSKLRGENAVNRFRDKVAVTVVRPSAVYGPRDREFLLIFKFVQKKFMPFWGDGKISLIYISDLIDGILRASGSDHAVGKTYFISDGNIYTNRDVIDEIASALSVSTYKISLPKPLLPAIGFFSDIISKIMKKNSMINRDKISEIMCSNWVCDITEAKTDLGFFPKINLAQGIKWTADWYKNQKWL